MPHSTAQYNASFYREYLRVERQGPYALLVFRCRTMELGVRLYVDQSTDTVYSCTCPFRCSSAGCDYIVEAGFGGLSTMSCRGECEALETCTAPAPGTEQPSDETETGGDLQSPDQLDCSLLSCAEDDMHPTEPGYHGWILDMLERTQ